MFFSISITSALFAGTILGLAGLVIYVFLRCLLSFTHHAKEPLAVATEIPYLSPMIGMAKKAQFYIDLDDKYNLPIYTLRLPGSRIYVVNSIRLISAVERHPRVFGFAPIKTRFAVNVTGVKSVGQRILRMNGNVVDAHSYFISHRKAIDSALSPGVHLDAMNRFSVQNVLELLNILASNTPTTIKLFQWVRRNLTWATTEAVYGPKNPFRNAEIASAFWKFDSGVIILLLKLCPSVLAKESLYARERFIKAFMNYFDNAGHEQGSALIRARYNHSIGYNFSIEDIARFELGGAMTNLSTTIPAAFWVLWHVISDVDIIEKCRKELYSLCKIDDARIMINLTKIETSCPILLSTFREVLRYHGVGISVRTVQQNHILDDQYFLRKHSTLMIPNNVQHRSKAVYGENVDQFDHHRFVRSDSDRGRLNSTAFRGFGGGSTLCPGRHFARTEIIALVALMILRFDFRPLSGTWVRPTTGKAVMHTSVPPPDTDVEVEVTLRGGLLAGKQWHVILGGTDEAVELVAKDPVAKDLVAKDLVAKDLVAKDLVAKDLVTKDLHSD